MKPLLLSALLLMSSSCSTSCSALPPPGPPAAAIDDEDGDDDDEDLPRVTSMPAAVQMATVHVLPDDGSLALGPPTARHTLTVFVDFESSAAVLVQLLDAVAIEAKRDGRARVVVKHFPALVNLQAREIAWSVLAAREVGGDAAAFAFIRAHAAAQADGKAFDRAALAKQVGVDIARFGAAFAAGTTRPRRKPTDDDAALSPYDSTIERDLTLARAASVRQVPMAFLDGQRVQASSWSSLQTMLTAPPASW